MGRRLGNYQVRALIGCGAMGAVYLAHDEVLERPVALKVLLGSLARNVEHVRRFQREARAAARMNHPNIVRIYEAGVREGIPFMAMEYVDGESFDRFLARNGAMHWRRALEVALQMAQALACAHEQGVVHRDVKPANMLIDKAGRLRLADFGIARVRDQGSGLTDHDAFIGTPEFMSPEQCAGQRDIGPQADLFSLGVTLYRMISGRMPFVGSSTAALIGSICHDEPPRLNRLMPEVPDDVARLVARLMDKRPESRPQSAVLVAATISELLESDGGSSVISAALDAFIRDQAQPREVELWTTPTPNEQKTVQKKRMPLVRKTRRRLHYAPVSAFAQWAAAGLVAMAIAGAGIWLVAAERPVEAAPLLTKVPFTMAAPGVYRLPLPEGPWRVARLAWAADARRVVAVLEGEAASPMAGACGVVTISADDGAVVSVVAPSAPWRGEGLAPASGPDSAAQWPGAFALASAGMEWQHPGWQGAEALVRGAPMEDGAGWALMVHPLDRVAPLREPAAMLPGAPVAMAAAGGALAVAVTGDDGETLYQWRDSGWLRLTPAPVALLHDSLQLSADGQTLYAQWREGGEDALWRLRLTTDGEGTTQSPGRLEKVARGAWRGQAVHVQGEWAIVCDASGMLQRLHFDGAGGATPIGPGDVTRGAFAPGGDFAVAAMEDASGAQLVALPSSEAQPIVLTRFERAALRGAVVSGDGARVAAILREGGREEIVIAGLSRFGLAPAAEV